MLNPLQRSHEPKKGEFHHIKNPKADKAQRFKERQLLQLHILDLDHQLDLVQNHDLDLLFDQNHLQSKEV